MDHLQHSGKSDGEQREALVSIVWNTPFLMEVMTSLREVNLPEWWVVSGAIYNTVWNHLTDKPLQTGIKDIDVIYFDDHDLSYDAEDEQITLVNRIFDGFTIPIELRNQARTHLWYPKKFGRPYSPLKSAAESLERYASLTHAVAVRLETDDSFSIFAPFGLDHMFSFKMVPNYPLNNRQTHEEKGARAKSIWPQLEVVPW